MQSEPKPVIATLQHERRTHAAVDVLPLCVYDVLGAAVLVGSACVFYMLSDLRDVQQ